MTPYFPFTQDTFAVAMGTRPLQPPARLFDVTASRDEELALKQRLLDDGRVVRCRALSGTEALVAEALEFLSATFAREYPELAVRADTLAGFTRLVQEDVCLLDGHAPGVPLVAGSLCFPSMWSLEEKLGKPLLAIHEPVPFFAQHLGKATQALLERMRPGVTVWRLNWGLYPTPRLDLEPHTLPEWQHLAHRVTPEHAGELLYLRVERQTLTRLPRTGAIVFTIHTYVSSVADEAADRERRQRMRAVLSTVPPESQRYKRLSEFLPALLTWLSGA